MTAGYFVPAAEQMGIVHLIDRFALETAIATLKAHKHVTLAVNVSGTAAGDPAWLQSFVEYIRDNTEVAHRLIVELTETAALHHFEENARFVTQLRGLGRQGGDRRFRRRLYLIPQSADAACRYRQDRRLLCEEPHANARKTRSLSAPLSVWPRIWASRRWRNGSARMPMPPCCKASAWIISRASISESRFWTRNGPRAELSADQP